MAMTANKRASSVWVEAERTAAASTERTTECLTLKGREGFLALSHAVTHERRHFGIPEFRDSI